VHQRRDECEQPERHQRRHQVTVHQEPVRTRERAEHIERDTDPQADHHQPGPQPRPASTVLERSGRSSREPSRNQHDTQRDDEDRLDAVGQRLVEPGGYLVGVTAAGEQVGRDG